MIGIYFRAICLAVFIHCVFAAPSAVVAMPFVNTVGFINFSSSFDNIPATFPLAFESWSICFAIALAFSVVKFIFDRFSARSREFRISFMSNVPVFAIEPSKACFINASSNFSTSLGLRGFMKSS